MLKADRIKAPKVSAAKTKKRQQTGKPKARKTKKAQTSRGWGMWAAKWLFVAGLWSGMGVAAAVIYLAVSLPPIDEVDTGSEQPAIKVLANSGETIAQLGELDGEQITVSVLPDHMIQAVLAIEDRRFYRHFGIDIRGIARAALANYQAGRTVQGGSTITQQLAKIMFLSPERTLRRKAHEALLALWLEWQYTKDEILSAYLNRAYFGGGAYGLDAASRLYFGHSATSVTVKEAALLAGLLKAPSYFAPTRSRDAADARAEVVLGAMVDAGFITEGELNNQNRLFPVPRPRPPTGGAGRYFADWVADELPQHIGEVRQDIAVRTTLDPRLQRAAEAAVIDVLSAESEASEANQAAMVVMRTDGAVLAMVGGRSYSASQFNRATQAWRQPGSAFKPIIYLTALEKGLRPDTLILDSPVDIRGYAPANYDGKYAGEITLRTALADSSNSAAVRLMDWVSIDETMATGRRLGLSGKMRRDLSLALGGSETTLLELTSVYAAFANGGRAAWPYAIEWVEREDGSTLYARQSSGGLEIARPWHVSELNLMLASVMSEGTGRSAALNRPTAGKTGTSEGYRDAWFVGFTADYVAGVWVGNDDNAPMKNVTGGGMPARIWRNFMETAHLGLPPRPLPGLIGTTADGTAIIAENDTPPEGNNPIARFLSNLFGG